MTGNLTEYLRFCNVAETKEYATVTEFVRTARRMGLVLAENGDGAQPLKLYLPGFESVVCEMFDIDMAELARETQDVSRTLSSLEWNPGG